MRHLAFIIHLAALAILFTTMGQPGADDKPAGIRRAVEAVAKAGPLKSQIFKIYIQAR